MKAVRYSQFGGPEVLKAVELPDPHAGPGQTRVAVRAAGGVDVALDVAGSGVLPELIELAGGPEHVVTITDFGGGAAPPE